MCQKGRPFLAQIKKCGANYKMKGKGIIMPKFIRNNLNGTEYVHVTTHGIAKEYIYEKTNEKEEIRKLILENQEKFNINIIAYCIMSNHLHILIKFKEQRDLSNYMHKINTSYAIYYNKRHNRQGYVYKDRFHTQIIKNINHLRNAVIYIHNNPVKAQICSKAKDYKFSSYVSYWKDRKNNVIQIFESKKQYKEMHDNDDIQIECISDFEEISNEDINIILIEYLRKKNITIDELKEDKEKLFEICSILKIKYKVPYRELENIIKVSREKIRRLIKNKKVCQKGTTPLAQGGKK